MPQNIHEIICILTAEKNHTRNFEENQKFAHQHIFIDDMMQRLYFPQPFGLCVNCFRVYTFIRVKHVCWGR